MEQSVEQSVEQSAEQSVELAAGQMVEQPIRQKAGQEGELTGGMVAGRGAEKLAEQVIGQSVGQSVGESAEHLAGQSLGLMDGKQQVQEGGTQVAADYSAQQGRKGDAGSNKGFSLKAMRDRAIKSQQSVEPTVNIVDKELDAQEMEQAWEWLAAQEKAAGRVSLAAYMTHKKPIFDTSSGKIVFEVGNRTQKEWIENKARVRMETELRLKLSNSTLTLEIEVHQADEEEKKEMMYMPEDKAKFLLSNNEELRELKKDFGLEVK